MALSTFNTGRRCGHCDALLTVREGEPAWNFNRRSHCNKLCARRNTVSSGRPALPIVHGTPRGYRKCRQRDEGACDLCVRAQTEDGKTRRSSGEYQRRRTARGRALNELARRYPYDFQALLDKELSA